MNVDAYSLEGPWRDAFNRIVAMMETGIAGGHDHLPEGPSSAHGVEHYARAICEANPRANLGIAYGLASVAICVAAQGGIIAEAPIAGGGWLRIPAIQHMLGVAPSGWRKSSALKVAQDPLDRAIAAGIRHRGRLVRKAIREAKKQVTLENRGNPDFTINDKQFLEIFNEGLCTQTLVKDPTVEALRNLAVFNGGICAALAGEADIFRNVTAYSNDSGSLTFFLDLWDQATINTARVGAGSLVMDDAALQIGVLFQTDVFAEVTSGSGGRNGAGADSFLSRGMFGRIWVVEAGETGGFDEIAASYGDDVEHDLGGLDGYSSSAGEMTPLGLAMADYELTLHKLMEETNEYRAHKAWDHAWKVASAKLGADLQVPEIEAQPREALRLSRDAQRSYNRLQRLYNALEAALAEMDEDAQVMWGPLVARYVQHTMREALVVTLSSGSREITSTTIEDCAVRLIPWRWALTTKALGRRTAERVEDILAAASMDNPRGEDRTPEGQVLKVLQIMAKNDPQGRTLGWGRSEIAKRVTSALPRQARKNVSARVHKALLELSANATETGVRKIVTGKNPVGGQPIEKFVIEEWAIQY